MIYSLPQQKKMTIDIKCQYLTINVSTVVDVNHFLAAIYVDRQKNSQMKQINDILSRQ